MRPIIARQRAPGSGPWDREYIRNWRGIPRRPYQLTAVLDLYLEVRERFQSEKTRNGIRLAFRKAIRVFDNCCFTDISRLDVIRFAQNLADQGLTRGGIQHNLYLLHAGVRVFIKEYGLALHNPFSTFRASELWPEVTERPLLTKEQLILLRTACMREDDDIRWLLALLIDTGARVNEIAGLALADIFVDASPPFLVIKVHPWRGLKTPASARRMPLIGAAVWAARRIIDNARANQTVAFPRYVRNGRLHHSVKSTLGSWLAAREFTGNPTTIRRTFVERLRAVGCPEDVRASLAGWRLVGMEEEYGIGYNVETLYRWICRIDARPLVDFKTAVGTTGYDRQLSLYECGMAVIALIRQMPYPSLQEMVREGSVARPDIVRGLRYAKRHGSIALTSAISLTSRPTYEVTNVALPRTPWAARPRQRKRADASHYDHRKLLLALPWPPRFQPAMTPVIVGLQDHVSAGRAGAIGHRSMRRLDRLLRHDDQETQ